MRKAKSANGASFSNPPRGFVLALLWAGMFALSAWAQSQQAPLPPPPEKPQGAGSQDVDNSRPALKVLSQMVQVDVVAKDHNGQPVKNLRQSDFSVYDNGKKQEIAFFSLETDKTKNLPAAPVAPDIYSNLIEKKNGVPGNLTIIMLDFLNTKFTDMVLAKSAVMKMLDQIRPEDRVAVYALTSMSGSIYVLHDFTSDVTALKHTIQGFTQTDSGNLAALSSVAAVAGNTGGYKDPDAAGFLQEAMKSMADFSSLDRVLTTTDDFKIIADHMVRIPGRKNLVWVSGSFPFSINENYDAEAGAGASKFAGPGAIHPSGGSAEGLAVYTAEEYEDFIIAAERELANANIAVYPVDAHGLVAPGGDYAVDAGSITGSSTEIMPISGGDPSTTPGSMLSTNFDSMSHIAQQTGGKMFASTNDLAGAVHSAMEDGRVSYMIAYYPTPIDARGKYHTIHLKLNRPGVTIRYRNGYYAQPLTYNQQANTAPIILQTLFSPLDATGLGMTIHATGKTVNGERTLSLEMNFQQGDISFNYDNGRTEGTIKVVMAQFDEHGNEIGGDTTTIAMHLSQSTYTTVRQDDLRFKRDFPLKPEAVSVKIIACDDTSGAVGSISIPLAKYFPATTTN